MRPRGNHAPVRHACVRSAGYAYICVCVSVCVCVCVWAQFQCARIHGARIQCAHNEVVSLLVISKTFLPVYSARTSLRNERRLHAVERIGGS